MNFDKWYQSYHGSRPEYTDDGNYQFKAWQACKEEVLKILSKPLKNLDLSEDFCDSRYIDKIKRL